MLENVPPYKDVLDLQLEEFSKRVEAKKMGEQVPEDVIFFVQHRPVYTLGKHGKLSNLLFSQSQLEQHGIEFMSIGRGGDITYHGPGQLTVYPIVDLQRIGMGVKSYVWGLEEAVIQTIAHYGIKGERIEGKTGVWICKDGGMPRKISAVGVRCSRFVTMHGLSFNVGMDLSGFEGIVPCGLPLGVTSLSRETGKEIELTEAKNIIEEKLVRILQPRIPSQGNS